MDEVGQKHLSDNSPLLKIKKAIERVKKEIRLIDIRIGVVSNTLLSDLQVKLKERHNNTSGGDKDDNDNLFNDDDMEL